jgi:hypothetical protein
LDGHLEHLARYDFDCTFIPLEPIFYERGSGLRTQFFNPQLANCVFV